jgi:hypothetical protein
LHINVIARINCVLFFFKANYMAKNSSSGATSSAPTRSNDLTWAPKQAVVGAKNSSMCLL